MAERELLSSLIESENEFDAVQRRLLELSELFPLTFWKHLDRLNVQEQRTPRWSFLINTNGIQCNIYWENKTEEEKIIEEAAQGGHALKKADQWLKDAQNANLENLSPDEVNKTVQSILSFFSPLNNNNSKIEDLNDGESADELVNKLQSRLSGQKRKAPPPKSLSIAPKIPKIVHPSPSGVPGGSYVTLKSSKTNLEKVNSDIGVADNAPISVTCTPVQTFGPNPLTIGQKLVAKKIKPTILPNGTLLGQVVNSGKGKKILCYMPNNMTKNVPAVTVRIPINNKSDKVTDSAKTSAESPTNISDKRSSSSETADNNTFTTSEQQEEEIIKVEPLDPDADRSSSTSSPICPDENGKPKKIQLKISS